MVIGSDFRSDGVLRKCEIKYCCWLLLVNTFVLRQISGICDTVGFR